MKLSKSKLALAKVINENGGWVDDSANWAVQPKHENGGVWFSTSQSKPYSPSGELGFTFKGQGCWLRVVARFDKVLPNWHQCVLSREEYYHAYPKADADGWIEHDGKHEPAVATSGLTLWCRWSDGLEQSHEANMVDWIDDSDVRIIAYRLHKPVVKPEFCESVTRSIPGSESIDELCAKVTEENKHQHVDAKPTIEQLAQDYRNKLDFANSKQQEADEAKAAADAALGELERAGEALWLLIGIAKPDQEQELVITDWRNLLVGDIIEIVGSKNKSWLRFKGVELFVTRTGAAERGIVFRSRDGDEWGHSGNTNWRFIRRP